MEGGGQPRYDLNLYVDDNKREERRNLGLVHSTPNVIYAFIHISS